MDSNRNCCNTTFNVTSKRFVASIFPQLKIKFNFLFKSYHLNILETQDSTTQFLPQDRPSWNVDSTSSCSVVVEESLSFEDMVEAIVEEIGERLDEEDLTELVDLAWEEVTKSFPTKTLPKYNILYLFFEIRTEHMHVYVVENDYPRKNSVLKKYDDVGPAKEGERERPCYICLEELDGGALITPCLHVFHGDCIKKWLRKSHYCPVCRSEMPKE